MMKKWIACALAAVCLMAVLFGCASTTTGDIANQDQLSAEASGLTFHKIGVATYDIQDAQIRMFKNYLDVQKEVEFCVAHEMYYIRPTATSSEEDFQAVADNPYFVGEIGPGADMNMR